MTLTEQQFQRAAETMELMGMGFDAAEHVVIKDSPMYTLHRADGSGFFYNGATGQVFVTGGPRDGENVTQGWLRIAKGGRI
ncbi:hypothetical protein [Bhargavaea ginsengi]|uniref:hypothetical protein n=1 Tax=Bhargavaea ginsengi TaxID=426757 RepID=UPI003C757E62